MNPDSGSAPLPPKLQDIYEGKYDGICTAHDFLTHMPGSGVCHELPQREESRQLRVFWYPTETGEPDKNFRTGTSTSTSAAKPGSLQDKIKSLILSLKYLRADYLLVQLWIPKTTSSGQIILTVSGQPFGLGELYNGLCRYRYYCIQQANGVEDISQLGPLVRVFTRGYPELCRNIECYSVEEFPTRDYAKLCGIMDYWALPIFERDHDEQQQRQQQCIGVLEFLSFGRHVYPDMWSLQYSDFECTSSHFQECNKIRRNVLKSTVDMYVLNCVRTEHQLPLIQVWVPCMCDGPEALVEYQDNTSSLSNTASRITQLFCQLTCIDWDMKYSWDSRFLNLSYGTYSVKNGKGLLGRAYSQKKSCFCTDTSKFSISDYPLVHVTRSSGLAACFAIPLELIHANLHPLILEVFLPPQQNCDGNLRALLKSLLSTVAQELSMGNAAFGLTQAEELCVEFSHSDDNNFIYFDVYRSSGVINRGEALGSGREENQFPASHQPPTLEDNVEHRETDDAAEHSILTHHPNTQNRAETSILNTNGDTQIASDAIRNGQAEIVAENLEGDQVQNHEILGSKKEGQQFLKPDQPLTLETSDHANTQDTVETSRKVCTSGEADITLDTIKQYFGRNISDAAEEFEVSVSTLKRRCRTFGIKRWPSHKRNKVHRIQQSARLPAISVEGGGEIIQESKIGHHDAREKEEATSAKGKSIETGHEEIDQSCTTIVKATYRDDTIKFRLCSNSSIKELCKELDRRFELKVERFKIKYEDEDGKWILMVLNEDLHLHMETLKSAGQTEMNLLVTT